MKIIKKIIIALSIATSSAMLFGSSVFAENLIDTSLYAKEDLPLYIRFAELDVKTKHVYHKFEDEDMPAYCLNEDLIGVTKEKTYPVDVESEIADMDIGLWRVIINGYPYKTVEELGCEYESQAYTATQQAIYYYLYNKNAKSDAAKRKLYQYTDTGSKGVVTLNAMKKILSDAENSTEEKPSKEIVVTENNQEWVEDEKDNTYVYKTYSVSSVTEMESYEVAIKNVDENILDKIKIVDKNDEVKEKFDMEEEFKVMVPEKEIEEAVVFDIGVTANLKTMPIYFGKPSSDENQSYALTAMYEKVEKAIEEFYEVKSNPVKVAEAPKKLPQTGM